MDLQRLGESTLSDACQHVTVTQTKEAVTLLAIFISFLMCGGQLPH